MSVFDLVDDSEFDDVVKILVWPDGVWCYPEEWDEASLGKSDDVHIMKVPDHWTEEEIDAHIDKVNNILHGGRTNG